MNTKIKLILLLIGSFYSTSLAHKWCNVPDEWLYSNISSNSIIPWARWPNGIAKYELHTSLSDQHKIEALRAIEDIESKTCLRFVPRSPNEESYISIEHDDGVCGVGSICVWGGYQFAKFGGSCATWQVMVHELGHNLCFGHEQDRPDRDEYLHYEGCSGEPGKDYNMDLMGTLFDYASTMHYGCGSCSVGYPKMEGVEDCGSGTGLSVMDADKLNQFYECRGCLSHRWRPIDNLTDSDVNDLFAMGFTDSGTPLYACRGYVNGEISIGKFVLQSRICYLPYGGREHQRTRQAQVLTVPDAVTLGSKYRIVDRMTPRTKAVKEITAGRKVSTVPSFIAVGLVQVGDRWEESIGKVSQDELDKAYFPFGGQEIATNDFGIVVCDDEM